MTCIVGVVEQGTVLMGGDSAISNGDGHQSIAILPKVFFLAERRLLLGCADSTRLPQVLQYALPVPTYEQGVGVEAYLVHLIGAVRACLKQAGEDDHEMGGTLLVGLMGRLFEVQSDYSFVEPSCGYEAIGSGGQVALGALHVTSHLPARARIEGALAAAAMHNAYVRPPFVIECLESSLCMMGERASFQEKG